MQVKQVYTLVNDATKMIVGETAVLKEDLSNIADFGQKLFSLTDVDNYVKTLADKVGKIIFSIKKYSASAPSIFMSSWEYGSILQKISAEIPEAELNESWKLTDKTSVDQDIFRSPTVTTMFYNNKLSFDIPMSFTERQVKESFNSASELNAFISMIINAINNSMTVKIDALIMRTLNSMIASTVHDEYGSVASQADYGKKSTSKAVNLLKLYKDKTGNALTSAKALTNSDFLKFASYIIGVYQNRLLTLSKIFNVGNEARFTDKNDLTTVLLSDFKLSLESNVLSNSYNQSYLKLPEADLVTFWQGSGLDYSFNSISNVNVEIDGAVTNLTGVIGIMFDRNSCGVCNTDSRVTTHYNARGEFYNNFYKFDASYFSDLNENFVVFFVHD